MPTRLRSVLYLIVAALASAALAACGGGDENASGKAASSSTNVDQLLKETFTGEKKVDSGKLALAVAIDAKGAEGAEGVDGPVDVKLGGPFQTQGEGKLPAFKLDLAFSGAGQDIKAGLTSTGDKAFVNFNNTDYAVSDQVYKQFRAGYEQAQKQAADRNKGEQNSLAKLGIDPRNWLTNAKNEGEAKVGEADTIKITGGVDVSKLLDDVDTALGKASSLGLQNTGQLPQKLTAEQKKQVTDAVKDAKVEIYSGKEDKILRRLVVAVNIVAPAGSSDDVESAVVKLDFSLIELNEDQEIAAPSNTKPFDELLRQFGGLGGLGGGSGSGSGSGSGTADQAKLKKYTDCITEAGSNTGKAQKCAELLQP